MASHADGRDIPFQNELDCPAFHRSYHENLKHGMEMNQITCLLDYPYRGFDIRLCSFHPHGVHKRLRRNKSPLFSSSSLDVRFGRQEEGASEATYKVALSR